MPLVEKIIGGKSPLYKEKPMPHVIAAAWLDPSGKDIAGKDINGNVIYGDIYTGDHHQDAWQNALQAGVKDAKDAMNADVGFHDYLRQCGWRDGYLTNKNEWIPREIALKMALDAKQVKNHGQKRLDSVDIINNT